ncbi:hypothetical protein ACJD0Z_04060 [Flavobacteriaceae bacterium M23B6Z8]
MKNFSGKYALSVHTDPKTQQNYIKLPIADLAELSYMQQALLEGLLYLNQLEDQRPGKELQNSRYWLLKIVLATYPGEELEGVSEWLKNE